jgi:hypothetical protein
MNTEVKLFLLDGNLLLLDMFIVPENLEEAIPHAVRPNEGDIVRFCSAVSALERMPYKGQERRAQAHKIAATLEDSKFPIPQSIVLAILDGQTELLSDARMECLHFLTLNEKLMVHCRKGFVGGFGKE